MVGKRIYFCMPTSLVSNLNDKYQFKHFAWIIILIASIIQMVGSTIRNVFGVMVEPMSETFSWSQGEIGLGYAIAALCTAVFSPIAGILGDIFGAKRFKSAFFGHFPLYKCSGPLMLDNETVVRTDFRFIFLTNVK